MSNITSFEILDREIKNIQGRPTVLEALWDGDTQGWFLILNLYVEKGYSLWKKEEVKQLGVISFGGDIRLFNGLTPPWPEAEMAKTWGRQASEKYGLTFYFPSDKEPDSDCPNWWQRHLAIKCADCGKLIIPNDSPYLPREICYSCHLKREHNEKIRNETPSDDGVNIYSSNNEDYEHIGYCTHFKDFNIAPFVIDKVKAQLSENSITIVTLNKEDILELKASLENVLAQKLDKYESPVITEQQKRFITIQTVEYKGHHYELAERFNHEHSEIANLISSVNTAESAIARNYEYKIFFKNGFTYRDDTMLRFVNYVCEGSTTISEINKHYEKVLTTDLVMGTLRKLVKMDCLTIRDDQVAITSTGKKIL